MRMIIGQRAIEFRTSPRLALVLCLLGSLASSLTRAEGLHPELGLALSGLVSMGELASVRGHGVGGDGAPHVVQIYRGFGIRGALGYQRLQGHVMPTGEIINNGSGTQEGVFRATQNLLFPASRDL